MAEKLPRLSVVVTSFNQKEHLARLLPQLQSQSFDSALTEIIVVDDCSQDGSREFLQSITSIKLLANDINRGRAASRNRGILAATGDVIVMIDGDHTVRPDFLATHASKHQVNRCVVVGKSILEDHPDSRALNNYLNKAGATKIPRTIPIPGRYFQTGNCSVPRDLLISVGLFDESFSGWGGEDLDLGIRIENTGIPIYGDVETVAIHHHLRSLTALLNNLYHYGKSGIPLLIKKHPRLFYELNLDHSMTSDSTPSRFGLLHRLAFRLLFTSPVFIGVKCIAYVFRRHSLPRMLFDYLHLREYSRGYADSLKENTRTQSCP